MTTDDRETALRIPIGEVVKAWRLARGWTPTELIASAGRPLTKGYLSQLEHGKIAQPREERLQQLADVLGITLWDLVTRRLPSDPPNASDKGPVSVSGPGDGEPKSQIDDDDPVQDDDLARHQNVASPIPDPDLPTQRVVRSWNIGTRNYPGTTQRSDEPVNNETRTVVSKRIRTTSDRDAIGALLERLPQSARITPEQFTLIAGFIRAGLEWVEHQANEEVCP